MMKRRLLSSGLWRVWVPGGSLLLISGCGLSDAQWTSILESAITTGLTALTTQFAQAIVSAVTGGAAA
jgi:hypothetical protein